MPRPRKCRRVGFIPTNHYFSPYKTGEVEEVLLSIEEVESIRLADWEGFDQNLCAEQMDVSRGTFQRILNEARSKLADALIHGKAIRIAGGNYLMAAYRGRCQKCRCIWEDSEPSSESADSLPSDMTPAPPPHVCPNCRRT